MNISWKRKLRIIVYLSLSNSGRKKAEYLKSLNIFKMFGDNNFWYSRNIPADAELVEIHNNVKVATDVYFCTHDVLHDMFNNDPNLVGGGIKGTLRELKYLTIVLLGRNPLLCME